MPKKLTKLKITKVDFVDAGANPDADILLYKRRDDGAAEKGTETFRENLNRRNLDKISEDMWNLSYALNDSLLSILGDEELDAAQKQTAMLTSLEEFTETAREAVTSWVSGTAVGLVVKAENSEALNPLTQAVAESMAESIAKAWDRIRARLPLANPVEKKEETNHTEAKGEEPNMRIDKSKLTPEEAATLETIEKKAGIPDEPPVSGDTPPADGGGQEPQPTAKSAPAAPVAAPEPVSGTSGTSERGESDEDIYKKLPPKFRKEFEALKKFRQDAEDAALREVAKGYEILGKSADDLFLVLKSLKATDEGAYNQMIATLDNAKTAVEKSGVFNEIGRTGSGSVTSGGAVQETEAKAVELMKSRKDLTRQQAIDQVLQADPALAKRYETEE